MRSHLLFTSAWKGAEYQNRRPTSLSPIYAQRLNAHARSRSPRQRGASAQARHRNHYNARLDDGSYLVRELRATEDLRAIREGTPARLDEIKQE